MYRAIFVMVAKVKKTAPPILPPAGGEEMEEMETKGANMIKDE